MAVGGYGFALWYGRCGICGVDYYDRYTHLIDTHGWAPQGSVFTTVRDGFTFVRAQCTNSEDTAMEGINAFVAGAKANYYDAIAAYTVEPSSERFMAVRKASRALWSARLTAYGVDCGDCDGTGLVAGPKHVGVMARFQDEGECPTCDGWGRVLQVN